MFNILGETLPINLATGVLLVTSHHLGYAYIFLTKQYKSWTNAIIVSVCLNRLETDESNVTAYMCFTDVDKSPTLSYNIVLVLY